jgi:hypothetical protein
MRMVEESNEHFSLLSLALGSLEFNWDGRAERDADRALDALRSREVSMGAVRIGSVREGRAGLVTLQSCIGGNRVLDMRSGEKLPRIS